MAGPGGGDTGEKASVSTIVPGKRRVKGSSPKRLALRATVTAPAQRLSSRANVERQTKSLPSSPIHQARASRLDQPGRLEQQRCRDRDRERDHEAEQGQLEGLAAQFPEIDLQPREEEEKREADHRDHGDRFVEVDDAQDRGADDDPGDDLQHDGGQPQSLGKRPSSSGAPKPTATTIRRPPNEGMLRSPTTSPPVTGSFTAPDRLDMR